MKQLNIAYAGTALIMIMLLASNSSATTVTLSGTCNFSMINATNNSILFNLSNSGDASAIGIILNPQIVGGGNVNSTVYINSLPPGSSAINSMHIENISKKGSYVLNIFTQYNQGTSTFYTIFPCEFYYGSYVLSPLSVSSSIDKKGSLILNLTNDNSNAIDAKVEVLSPQGFEIGNATRSVNISAGANANYAFGISVPKGSYNATLPIISEVSYSNANTHYALFSTTDIVYDGNKKPSGINVSLYNILFGLIIIVILLLIAISKIKRKKETKKLKVDN